MLQFLGQAKGFCQTFSGTAQAVPSHPDCRMFQTCFSHSIGQFRSPGRQGRGKAQTGAPNVCLKEGKPQKVIQNVFLAVGQATGQA